MDLEKIKAFRQEKNPFAVRLGMTVEELRPGYSRITKTIEADDLNPLGYAHGGVYFTMADNAAGTAMASHGYMAVTVNATYNFFRAANVGDLLTAEANEVKGGKTIHVYEVSVTDQNGKLVGTGSFTFFKMEQKIEF